MVFVRAMKRFLLPAAITAGLRLVGLARRYEAHAPEGDIEAVMFTTSRGLLAPVLRQLEEQLQVLSKLFRPEAFTTTDRDYQPAHYEYIPENFDSRRFTNREDPKQ